MGNVLEWFTSANSPWWAAILTFVLGQRYATKSAREQRDADAKDRQLERKHASDLRRQEHESELAKTSAERDFAIQQESVRERREQARATWQHERGVAERATLAVAALRAEVSSQRAAGSLRPEVVHEFMRATEELRSSAPFKQSVQEIQETAQNFVVWYGVTATQISDLSEFDARMNDFSASIAERLRELDDTDPLAFESE